LLAAKARARATLAFDVCREWGSASIDSSGEPLRHVVGGIESNDPGRMAGLTMSRTSVSWLASSSAVSGVDVPWNVRAEDLVPIGMQGSKAGFRTRDK
jgi:hypothetical protein